MNLHKKIYAVKGFMIEMTQMSMDLKSCCILEKKKKEHTLRQIQTKCF